MRVSHELSTTEPKIVDARLVLVVAAVSLAIGISVAVTGSQSYGQITPSSERPQLSPADIQKLQHAQRSKRTTE
jgi:hypothetical protein